MGRVRYTLAEAKAEATRRAGEFVASRPDHEQWRHVSTSPHRFGAPSSASKHPTVWLAMYAPVSAEGSVVDGGELFVIVDLELRTVRIRPC